LQKLTVGVIAGLPLAANAFVIDIHDNGSPVTTVSAAETLVSSTAALHTANADTINFFDGSGSNGHFGDDACFPACSNTDFAMHAYGNFMIDTAGDWTFGVNTDDGISVKIDGFEIISFENPTNNIDLFSVLDLTAGLHSLDIVYFEHRGGASVEFFSAEGSHSSFNNSFNLVQSVPEPGSIALLGLGLIGLAGARKKSKTAA